jgi:4-carboxymuconolactone decarboxylase
MNIPGPGQRSFGDLAPKFAELTDQVLFGDIWQRPQLPARERSAAMAEAAQGQPA